MLVDVSMTLVSDVRVNFPLIRSHSHRDTLHTTPESRYKFPDGELVVKFHGYGRREISSTNEQAQQQPLSSVTPGQFTAARFSPGK